MIRQAISCDICGTEKRQTNHWFVAYEQGGELRVSGWHSRNRTRPGSKHLCGQTCLHKLVDDFMARTIVRTQPNAADADAGIAEPELPRMATDTSLTAQAGPVGPDFGEFESSARLIPPHEAAQLRNTSYRPPAALVRMPEREMGESLPQVAEEPSRASLREWRFEAWEREREREQRAVARLRTSR